jgi:hypothetical protein
MNVKIGRCPYQFNCAHNTFLAAMHRPKLPKLYPTKVMPSPTLPLMIRSVAMTKYTTPMTAINHVDMCYFSNELM